MPEPRISARQKAAIARRASWCCEYCRSQELFSPDPFVVEHIQPRFRDGTDDPSNLAFACQGCNGHKYTTTEAADPLSGRVVPLFHPRQDDWAGHFAWSADFTRVHWRDTDRSSYRREAEAQSPRSYKLQARPESSEGASAIDAPFKQSRAE